MFVNEPPLSLSDNNYAKAKSWCIVRAMGLLLPKQEAK